MTEVISLPVWCRTVSLCAINSEEQPLHIARSPNTSAFGFIFAFSNQT